MEHGEKFFDGIIDSPETERAAHVLMSLAIAGKGNSAIVAEVISNSSRDKGELEVMRSVHSLHVKLQKVSEGEVFTLRLFRVFEPKKLN